MNAIFRRRSIRTYTTQEVSDAQIKRLLEAGMNAPSAGNQQPWQFVVIKNKPVLHHLAEASPYANMLHGAAAAILVCGDLTNARHADFWVQDCSAAVENILLEVEESGLGAVWLGMYPREDRVAYLRKALKIPEEIIPFALISIGYPDETREPPNRYDESRVHYEHW